MFGWNSKGYLKDRRSQSSDCRLLGLVAGGSCLRRRWSCEHSPADGPKQSSTIFTWPLELDERPTAKKRLIWLSLTLSREDARSDKKKTACNTTLYIDCGWGTRCLQWTARREKFRVWFRVVLLSHHRWSVRSLSLARHPTRLAKLGQ